MKTIEVGIIVKKEYTEHDSDLTNVKEEIHKFKVKGTTHGMFGGFFNKYFYVAYLDPDGERNFTFICKLRDFKYMKQL